MSWFWGGHENLSFTSLDKIGGLLKVVNSQTAVYRATNSMFSPSLNFSNSLLDGNNKAQVTPLLSQLFQCKTSKNTLSKGLQILVIIRILILLPLFHFISLYTYTQAQWDKGGRRKELGDSTGSCTIMLQLIRFQCAGSSDLNWTYLAGHMYTQFWLGQTLTWPPFQNIITAEVTECLYSQFTFSIYLYLNIFSFLVDYIPSTS
jgi:hypothetical protein